MKDNDLKKQSNLFVVLSSFLCLVMVVSVFASDFRVKPSYALDTENASCYKCASGDVILYTYSTTPEEAKIATNSDGTCVTAARKKCDDEHKGTTHVSKSTPGTTGIVIAWIVGIVAIGYSIWYFIKLRTHK